MAIAFCSSCACSASLRLASAISCMDAVSSSVDAETFCASFATERLLSLICSMAWLISSMLAVSTLTESTIALEFVATSPTMLTMPWNELPVD